MAVGSDNVTKTIDGGDPIYLNSPITLCGRVDADPERAFSGRLTALTIFDDALSPNQVASLYAQGIGGLTNVSKSRELILSLHVPPSSAPRCASSSKSECLL